MGVRDRAVRKAEDLSRDIAFTLGGARAFY